jgi:membrane protease YdiL (CAAX protease family)
MDNAIETLVAYLTSVLPGLILAALVIILVRHQPRLRIALYLAIFVLLRDAMTPNGIWTFGSQGFFWMRLDTNPAFLVLFGVACLGISLSLYYFDRDNRPLFRWRRGSIPIGLLWGLAGAAVVFAPFIVMYQFTPNEQRGGSVPHDILPAVFAFAFLGNLLEEALFRGYVLGYLMEQTTPLRAGVASGVIFSFCHIYLAITVTSAGYPLLVFTLWEGVIAGLIGARWGVLASTMTHGGAIFLLASGLF